MSRDNALPPRLRVGWREWVGLPSLGLPAVKAKIDTGARTSALHAFAIERRAGPAGTVLRLHVHPLPGRTRLAVCCEAPLVDERVVRDSGGHEELRPVIRCMAHLGGHQWEIDLTVTNRDTMRFRMLLGRTALAGRALIDPLRSYCQGQPSLHGLYGIAPSRPLSAKAPRS